MHCMKEIFITVSLGVLFLTALFAQSENMKTKDHISTRELKMPDNNLFFKVIEGYEDYKIVATHYRTDKNEIRYILANSIGYNALKEKAKVMPEGSKIVKIGWSVKKMPTFPNALEADEVKRVEYMVKDSKKFNADGDNWGYARFVKKDGQYTAWNKGTKGCISCHASVKETDYLFTNLQSTH